MRKLVISYRRADSTAITGRIYDRLVQQYGSDSVFMDIKTIPPGVDFRGCIDEALRGSDVLLVVIGRTWLGPSRRRATRINEDDDPVRIEVETALRIGLKIIPVLVDGAHMPRAGDLPTGMKQFVYLNALEIDSGRYFHVHVDRLIRVLGHGDSSEREPARTPDTEPASDIDSAYYYRLTTAFQGPGKSLDVVTAGSRYVPSLAPTSDRDGQYWKITPIIETFYRLTSRSHGDGRSLDIIDDGQGNNIPCLAPSGAASGQYWKFTRLTGEYFRLTTKYRGPQLALDIVNDGINNTPILAPRANVSGQYWLLEKLPAAAPPYLY